MVEPITSSSDVLQSTHADPVQQKTPSIELVTPFPEFNKYVWVDPAQEAEKCMSKERIYTLKAWGTLAFLGGITTVAVVAAAIFKQWLIPVVLLFSGSLINPTRNSIFLKTKGLAHQKREDALHNLGMAQKISETREKHLKDHGYLFEIFALGLNPYAIKHLDLLAQANSQNNPYKALINLVGRVHYWKDIAAQHKREIETLDQKIQAKAQKMIAPGISIEKANKTKAAWLLLNMEKQKIEEENYLPAKLNAAYNLHIIADVCDAQKLEEFGSPLPSSYLDSLTFKGPEAQPYLYLHEETNSPPLSKAYLMDHSVNAIAKKIFGDAAILVA